MKNIRNTYVIFLGNLEEKGAWKMDIYKSG
jgi:hypothetical protein